MQEREPYNDVARDCVKYTMNRFGGAGYGAPAIQQFFADQAKISLRTYVRWLRKAGFRAASCWVTPTIPDRPSCKLCEDPAVLGRAHCSKHDPEPA
jgi:hypothetical protein